MRALFEVFERHRTSVDVVATSEVSVSVTIDDASRLEALVVDLRALGDVAIERNRGIVSIVGSGLSDGGAAMARALGAIGDIRVHMLSLSASGINLTVVVDGEQVKPAMRRLHDGLLRGAPHERRALALIGMGKMGRALAQLAPERGLRGGGDASIRRRADARITRESLGGAAGRDRVHRARRRAGEHPRLRRRGVSGGRGHHRLVRRSCPMVRAEVERTAGRAARRRRTSPSASRSSTASSREAARLFAGVPRLRRRTWSRRTTPRRRMRRRAPRRRSRDTAERASGGRDADHERARRLRARHARARCSTRHSSRCGSCTRRATGACSPKARSSPRAGSSAARGVFTMQDVLVSTATTPQEHPHD